MHCHCNTLQHIATHCNIHCNTQHTLQHTLTVKGHSSLVRDRASGQCNAVLDPPEKGGGPSQAQLYQMIHFIRWFFFRANVHSIGNVWHDSLFFLVGNVEAYMFMVCTYVDSVYTCHVCTRCVYTRVTYDHTCTHVINVHICTESEARVYGHIVTPPKNGNITLLTWHS